VSIDAGTPETYSKIHRTNKEDFEILLKNLEIAVNIRNKNGYDCAIGTQAILLEENSNELYDLACKLKDIGVDYFVIKPYTSHPYKKDNLNMDKLMDTWVQFSDSLRISGLSNDKFNTIVRYNTFDKQTKERDYDECNALDFWAYIDSCGDVYSCSTYLGNKDHVYGNLYKNTFKHIWDNKNKNNTNINGCRKICRMDKINKYLYDLKYKKIKHVNFI